MRSRILTVLAGALGLAAMVASAPALSSDSTDLCGPISTIFVTVATVTVHDVSTNTTPLSYPVEPLPTITVTYTTKVKSTLTLTVPPIETIHLTESTEEGDVSTSYDTTVFETVFVSVTHQQSALSSSTSAPLPTITVTHTTNIKSTLTLTVPLVETIHLTETIEEDDILTSYDTTVFETVFVSVTSQQSAPTSSSSNILAFIVENGTTFWLGGQTPASTESYITATSVVTIKPVNTVLPTTSKTSTLTVNSTIFSTHRQTMTRTLPAFNGSTTLTSDVHTASSFGTASRSIHASTGMYSNTTVTYGPVAMPGFPWPTGTAKSSKSTKPEISLITQETVDIYKTTVYSYSTSDHTAKEGFNVFSTPSSFFAGLSATSTAEGAWTTSIIDGETVSWNAHGVTQSCTDSSTRAPYTNTTSTSHIITADPSSTSSTQGVWTTAVINGHTVSWNAPYNASHPITAAPSSTSSAQAVWTTAVINGQTVSWNARYNATSASHITSASPASTSSAQGVWTTAVINSQTVSWDDNSVSVTTIVANRSIVSADPTDTASSAPKFFSSSSSTSADEPVTTIGSVLANATSVILSPFTSAGPSISISTATVIPLPASSTTPLSSTQVAGPSSTAISTSLSRSSTVIASSAMHSTTATCSFLTMISSSVFNSSTSSQVSITESNAVSTTSSAASAASSGPSACGELGDFVLNFDDIPPLSISNDSTFNQAQPIFSPYHHFDFSKGFTVGPPPVDPFLPESKPLLAEFTPYITTSTDSDNGGSAYMGNVDHDLSSCFGFNFYGASFGCDSFGPDCHFNFTGYRYDAINQVTKSVTSQQKVISACPTLDSLDCILTPVTLDTSFDNLDTIRIDVTVADVPKTWWMDDVRLGWFNNTCEKGTCRAKAPVRGPPLPLNV